MEGEEVKVHVVPSLDNPIRIQEYGVGIFSQCPTKSALKKNIKKKRVFVNNVLASTATLLNGGEIIRLVTSQQAPPIKKLIFPLKVLFEDEYLAAIYKPPGILVSGNGFKTIANALDQNLTPSATEDTTKPQPVHRLDYATTGVLLVGKCSSSIRTLNNMFEKRNVIKTYVAVTIGKMEAFGKISSNIENKSAQTTYKVMATVPSERFGMLNLVELSPESGRRHQLRIHLSELGNPILGDKNYGAENLILKGKGLYLHAHSVHFKHPFTCEDLQLKAELPKKFKRIFP